MRTLRVRVNERAYTVSVDQTGKDRFDATVNGERFELEVATSEHIASWLVRYSNEPIHAQTRVLPNGKVDVWLAGIPFPASVQAVGIGRYPIAREALRQESIGGEVRSLMPGRVTSILVKEGEAVKEGTPLLILEAMKMQNEITSPIAGEVKSVIAKEGATVKKDSVLILIE